MGRLGLPALPHGHSSARGPILSPWRWSGDMEKSPQDTKKGEQHATRRSRDSLSACRPVGVARSVFSPFSAATARQATRLLV